MFALSQKKNKNKNSFTKRKKKMRRLLAGCALNPRHMNNNDKELFLKAIYTRKNQQFKK